MPDATEQEIRVHLAARRYGEAFELVVECFQNKVFRLCCSLLFNEALAEDAAQDVFLRVWRALPAYRGESSVSTWIYSIARNTCMTRLRRETARPTVPLAEATQASEERQPGEPDIRGMIARLPEKYRQVLLLFYFEEKSYEEVAAMLNLPMGTVKTHLHRARKELAAALQSGGEEVSYGLRGV